MVETGWQGVPGWEQLPNWIAAVATVGALAAASFAGWWARQAALHTKAQAEAADEQVKLAGEQVELAVRTRLDSAAPLIYAKATPEQHPLW